MKLNQVAAQLYTLRDFCQTADALAETAAKVKAIGYEAVQVSGIGPIEPAEVAEIFSAAGVRVCATHERPDLIRQNPLQAVERVKAAGATYSAFPYPGDLDFSDPAAVKSMIADLDEAGKVFRENGCTLSYHNHAIEFVRIGDETLMEHILRATSPENLKFELDTYWVQYGGGDPVAWCEKLQDRMPVMHLKDYGFSPENKPAFAEIGSGNLDFKRIISAAEKSGCEWFIVEQDTCPGDPFDSIKKSFDYIRDNLVAG